MEVEEAYLFSYSKITVQGHWTFIKIMALGSLWAGGYTKNYAVSVLKHKVVCPLHMEVEESN